MFCSEIRAETLSWKHNNVCSTCGAVIVARRLSAESPRYGFKQVSGEAEHTILCLPNQGQAGYPLAIREVPPPANARSGFRGEFIG